MITEITSSITNLSNPTIRDHNQINQERDIKIANNRNQEIIEVITIKITKGKAIVILEIVISSQIKLKDKVICKIPTFKIVDIKIRGITKVALIIIGRITSLHDNLTIINNKTKKSMLNRMDYNNMDKQTHEIITVKIDFLSHRLSKIFLIIKNKINNFPVNKPISNKAISNKVIVKVIQSINSKVVCNKINLIVIILRLVNGKIQGKILIITKDKVKLAILKVNNKILNNLHHKQY